MNIEPHTHRFTVKRRFDNISAGDLQVTYGDTTVVALPDNKPVTILPRLRRWRSIEDLMVKDPAFVQQAVATAASKARALHDVWMTTASDNIMRLHALEEELNAE